MATTSVMGSSGLVPTLQVASIYDLGAHLVYEASTANPNPDLIFANGFELAVSPSTTTKYFYLGSHAVAKVSKNGTIDTLLYLHTDPLGSPVAQTSSTGAIAGTTTYLPYGGRYASTGTGNSTGIGYSHHYLDASGLIYMRARYYDPQLHRFISGDPNGVDASTALNFNRYSYANNSPYSKYDPSGRESTCVLRRSCAGGGAGSGSGIPMAVGGAAVVGLLTFETGGTIWGIAGAISRYGWVNGFLGNMGAIGGLAETGVVVGTGTVTATSVYSGLGTTFRGTSVAPDVAFGEGFYAKGASTDLFAHALDSSNPASAFVSTSTSADVAGQFGENVYAIRPTNGIDVNATLGDMSPFPYESEIAIPDYISPSDIRGVTLPDDNMSILNPDFEGGPDQ